MQLDDWVLCRLYNKKNIWEKMQQKKLEEELSISHGTPESEMGLNNQRTPESEMGLNNQRTPESEIDNGSFVDFDDTERIIDYAWQQAEGRDCTEGFRAVNIKEDNEWFMDFKFDDLQQPNYSVFGSNVDVSNPDFLFSSF